jgi:hypothetical protein
MQRKPDDGAIERLQRGAKFRIRGGFEKVREEKLRRGGEHSGKPTAQSGEPIQVARSGKPTSGVGMQERDQW